MRIIVLILVILLGFNSTAQAQWNPWSIQWSIGMPPQPISCESDPAQCFAYDNAGGVPSFWFKFPVNTIPPGCPAPIVEDQNWPCWHVDYVTRTPFPLSGPTITLDFTLDVCCGAVFGHETQPNNAGAATTSVWIFLQHVGDDGSNMNYRWWSVKSGSIAPANGIGVNHRYVLTVPLSYHDTAGHVNWGCVESGCTEAGFNDTLSHLGAIGITFGGGNAKGHGLYLTSGKARFYINSFTSP